MIIGARPRHTTGVTIYGFGRRQIAIYFMKQVAAEANLELFKRVLLNARGDALECFFTNEECFSVDDVPGRTYSLLQKRGGREIAITTRVGIRLGHYPEVHFSPACIVIPGAIEIAP
jgi:hypothetical protein